MFTQRPDSRVHGANIGPPGVDIGPRWPPHWFHEPYHIWRFNLNTKVLWLFTDRRANINITDCESCTAGSFCNGYGLSNPSGLCSAGYYCPGGQSSDSPVDYACSPGHYCLIGSWNQTGCPSGTYQAHWQRNTCDDCPAGFYCRALGELTHRDLVVPYDDIDLGQLWLR